VDIGRAFSFVFEDANWVKKILIGGLISLVPLLGGMVTYGYMLEIVRRAYEGSGDELPEWDDFGGYLLRGLILFAALLIWFLPVIVLLGCVVGLLIAATDTSDNDGVAVISSLVLFGVVSVLILVIVVWSVVFLPILAGRYAVERRFGALFEFGEIWSEVRRAGAVPLLLLFVTYLAASMIGQLGIIACFIGVIFTAFYSNLVIAHGAGQVYRRARSLGEPAAPTSAPAF